MCVPHWKMNARFQRIKAPMASAQGADDEEDNVQMPGGPQLDRPFHPAEWRGFGAGHRSPDDGYSRCHRGSLEFSHYWPAQLIYRPMSPWAGMFEGRAVGEVDLGAGHASSPLRFAGSLAYGLEGDERSLFIILALHTW